MALSDEERRRRHRLYQRTWRERHPEAAQKQDKEQRVRHKVRRQAASDRWRKRNPERVREYDRKKYLKRRNVIRAAKYGVTVAEIETWLEATQCQACCAPFERHAGYIDHDHATGEIRGVLCNACNYALGIALESPTRLRGLAKYIDAWSRKSRNSSGGRSSKSKKGGGE